MPVAGGIDSSLQLRYSWCYCARNKGKWTMAEPASEKRPPWEREEFPDIMLPIQAARLIGVSRMTIFRWIKWGWIQPVIVDGKRMLAKNQLEEVRQKREVKTRAE